MVGVQNPLLHYRKEKANIFFKHNSISDVTVKYIFIFK
jgi:hypothetical protein